MCRSKDLPLRFHCSTFSPPTPPPPSFYIYLLPPKYTSTFAKKINPGPPSCCAFPFFYFYLPCNLFIVLRCIACLSPTTLPPPSFAAAYLDGTHSLNLHPNLQLPLQPTRLHQASCLSVGYPPPSPPLFDIYTYLTYIFYFHISKTLCQAN